MSDDIRKGVSTIKLFLSQLILIEYHQNKLNYGNQNNCLWSESKAVSVVAGGILLIIGTSSSNPIPLTVNEEARYIGLTVGSDPEMEPGQEIGGVLRAGFALSVTNAELAGSVRPQIPSKGGT